MTQLNRDDSLAGTLGHSVARFYGDMIKNDVQEKIKTEREKIRAFPIHIIGVSLLIIIASTSFFDQVLNLRLNAVNEIQIDLIIYCAFMIIMLLVRPTKLRGDAILSKLEAKTNKDIEEFKAKLDNMLIELAYLSTEQMTSLLALLNAVNSSAPKKIIIRDLEWVNSDPQLATLTVVKDITSYIS